MNPYTRNLNRLEYVITYACTGRCKHCSEGEHTEKGEHIDGDVAAQAVRRLSEEYALDSMMTFGGEPLLYPEAVCKIHAAAKEAGIPKRQLITNGYFSRDTERIREVARDLATSGVNAVLLSVDAFHQETIPLQPVKVFAEAIRDCGVYLRVHPAWLISETDENPYNMRTRAILEEFVAMGIPVSDGNVIFPSGNALKYLSEYFDPNMVYVSPYAEDPADLHAISVGPSGDVLDGNIYRTDILEIVARYEPGRKGN